MRAKTEMHLRPTGHQQKLFLGVTPVGLELFCWADRAPGIRQSEGMKGEESFLIWVQPRFPESGADSPPCNYFGELKTTGTPCLRRSIA